jgi:hypothetical protein
VNYLVGNGPGNSLGATFLLSIVLELHCLSSVQSKYFQQILWIKYGALSYLVEASHGVITWQ